MDAKLIPNAIVEVRKARFGNALPLALIAGPCQMESRAHALEMASALKEIASRLSIGLVYKTSFDKANRTSGKSARGLGLDQALPVFAEIRDTLGLPVLTDVHENEQCARAAEAVDVLQIPAFLCRQTDLLVAAAKTGKTVNVKKGQFLAPWDMKNVVAKITGAGNRNVLVTERGASFGYNTLVSDMRSLPIMARDTGAPVIFDATHSVQQPGGQGTSSGGEREFVPVLARAAVAVGVAGVFIETHQDPDKAPSDGPNMVPLKEMEALLRRLIDFDRLAKDAEAEQGLTTGTRRAIPPLLKIVALVVFAQTIFTRAVDPVIPMIAGDLAIDVKTAALLSTAFAFPYAMVQPILGVTADFFGKTRLMNLCVLVMAIATLVCAVATDFTLLVAMRIVAGLVAGGVFPVAMALIGDLVPMHQRQVAIARLLGVALTANVLGASIAGIIGDLLGWRGVFGVLGVFSLAVALLAFFAFRNITLPKPPPFNRAAVIANFRDIFADPRAKVCFGAVFLEAIFIHGLFPYVGAAAAKHRRDAGVDRGPADRLLCDRRHRLFAAGALSGRRGARPPADADRRHARGRVPCADRAAFSLAGAGRRVRGVRARLLPAARLHPGPRHRPVADRARRGGLAAFLVVLHGPGDRPGGLRLRLRPWRAGADHRVRRAGAAWRGLHVLAAASPQDLTAPQP